MKVYTKVVFNMEDCSVIDEESYDYDGPVAECKGGGNTTTTTKSDPWGPTQPYWNQIMQGIQGTPAKTTTIGWDPNGVGRGGLGTPIRTTTPATPGLLQNQLANVNPYQQQAWDMTEANVGNTSNTDLLTGSRDYANRVLSGEMLDPTKNLNLAMNLQNGIADMGAWDMGASQAGRYGSDAWATGRGKQLADLQGNLYGQGMQQMTQMSQLAPSIYNAQYLPSQYLNALGQEQENRPWDLYGRAGQILQMPNGGAGSSTAPQNKPSPLLGMLGGAASGAAVGSALGPPGTAAGALYGAAGGAGLGYAGSK